MWTEEKIASVTLTRYTYDMIFTGIGCAAGAYLTFRILCYEHDRGENKYSDFLFMIMLAPVYASWILELVIVYFGVPGTPIGRITPSSCEESIAFEGRNGWPCFLKRLSAWIGRVKSGDGSFHLDEIEGVWIRNAVLYVAFVAVPMIVSILLRNARLKEEAAAAANGSGGDEDDLIDGKESIA